MKIKSLTTAVLLLTAQLGIGFPSKAEERHHHQHHVSLFLGGTHTDHDDGFTGGLEYEYLLNNNFGIGVLGEYTHLDHDTWIVGIPLILHPYGGLRFVAMPGVEITDDHDEFLFRLGVGYDIPAGDWIITPAFNIDFVDNEENLVFGISLGKTF